MPSISINIGDRLASWFPTVPAHWWLLSYDPMTVSDRERQTRCDLDLIDRLSDRAEQLMSEQDAR